MNDPSREKEGTQKSFTQLSQDLREEKDIFLTNPCLVKLKWKDDHIVVNDFAIKTYLGSFLKHFSIETNQQKKEIFIKFKDLSSVDTFVKEFADKKSFFSVLSYHNLVEQCDSEMISKKSILNLIKRNNEELQKTTNATLDRIISKTKRVK